MIVVPVALPNRRSRTQLGPGQSIGGIGLRLQLGLQAGGHQQALEEIVPIGGLGGCLLRKGAVLVGIDGKLQPQL